MKHITTKAILLKRIDFGEADRILTVLTKNRGKVTLLAKGSRRSKSKLAGGLELFSVADISYIDGRSDMKTVVGTKLDVYFSNIVKNIEKTMLGYEFLRLTHSYTEDDSEEEFFSLLHEALLALDEAEVSNNHIEAWFLVNLHVTSGHGLNTDHDLAGSNFSEESLYQFDYDNMSFVEHASGQYEPKHIKLLKLLGKIGKPAHLLKVQGADGLIDDLLVVLKRCTTT